MSYINKRVLEIINILFSTSFSPETLQGVLIASVIIFLWTVSLFLLMSLDISGINPFLILLGVSWQTFLYTGLFITAHDAMHGVVCPQNLKLNNLMGSLALGLYALFPYQELLKKHWLHHHSPATEKDPDFYRGEFKGFWFWYFSFMRSYFTWKQLAGLTIIWIGLKLGLHVANINLALFWAIPPLLSSLQLFYFGTFLAHKEPKEGYQNPHRASTHSLSTFWSFITCYHFGYHEEHHEYPHLPWWKLPEAYRLKRERLDDSLVSPLSATELIHY